MANFNRFEITEYGTETDTLIAPELAFPYPCIVGNEGVDANSEGKKIILAGTPLTGAQDPLKAKRDVVLKKAGESDTVYGYARWNIDVTKGDNNGTLVRFGWFDVEKVDPTVKSLVESLSGEDKTMGVEFIIGRAN